MNLVKRRVSTRLAAATAVCGMAAAGLALSAGTANAAGDTYTLPHGNAMWVASQWTTGRNAPAAGLFLLQNDSGGAPVQVYCIDFHTETGSGATYHETNYASEQLNNSGSIEWILTHSYPAVSDLTQLGKTFGGKTLDTNEAAAGTQLAIWHYSDGVNKKTSDPTTNAFAKALEKAAKGKTAPPAYTNAQVSITPNSATGEAGKSVGPFKVTATGTGSKGQSVDLTAQLSLSQHPNGVSLDDTKGSSITSVDNGGSFQIDVPSGTDAGNVTVTASVQGDQFGRAFEGKLKGKTAQRLIAAGSAHGASATATASWTAPTQPTQSPTPPASPSPSTSPSSSSSPSASPTQGQSVSPTSSPSATSSSSAVAPASSPAAPTSAPVPEATPSVVGGNATLPDTGASSSTPAIAGTAGGLVILGAATVFFMRKRKAASH